MGCKLSSRSTPIFHGVRVVHINGYVEDYPGPVTVSEVTGKPPKLACFSPAQLLSFSLRPLALDDTLEPGRLYFLLPQTVFRSDTSPVDLATLVARLTAIARTGGGAPTVAAAKPKLADGRVTRSHADQHTEDTRSLAPGGSEFGGRCAAYTDRGGIGGRMQSSARSWKPILDTIEERSLGRSSQSLSSRSSSC